MRWGWAPLLFSGGHAGAPGCGLSSAPTSTSTSAPRHPGRSCLPPLCPGRYGGLQGTRQGPGGGGVAGVPLGHRPVFRQVPGQWGPVCPAGSGPVPRVDETEKTVHVFTTEWDKQYPERRPLPCRQPRTAGHALAPPPRPPFLSWPGRCSADGMRQRLLERRFVPCWARMLRGAWLAPCGGERLSREQGAPQGALASPTRRGPGRGPLLNPNPPPHVAAAALPPRSRPTSSLGQN